MTYLADEQLNGMVMCREYDADSESQAIAIAEGMGWKYLGELQAAIECPEHVMAMIELQEAMVH